MATVFVATSSGCRVFTEAVEGATELADQEVGALASDAGGGCLAIVNQREVWRRDPRGIWSRFATCPIDLQSIVVVNGCVFAGSMADEAVVFRVAAGGAVERLQGFDNLPGRGEWFAGGPPLGVRSLAVTADGSTILAAVHVGGIPRSEDLGESWTPTLPVLFDVHEVRAHPVLPNVVAAAAAVGLCVSDDGGRAWKVLSEGLEITNSLAIAALEDEVLFSIQDGPFAARSQVWRWKIGSERVEQVRDGLPEWLDGKVDTAHIAAAGGRAAILDGSGSLWLSRVGSTGWARIASGVGYAFGILVV